MGSDLSELAGTTLGECELIKLLGAGGMGSVFLAEHNTLQMNVAIKVLAPHLNEDQQFIVRFYREAQQTARLEHPNIVRVFGVNEDKGYHFIIMNYIDGTSLEELLTRTSISEKIAIIYLLQTLAALDYAHKENIVHRDIKPANLMLSKKGKIKITDFGLVRNISRKMGIMQENVALGTPAYMPPEQWENDEIDNRADIFAAGVTLYNLLTNAHPYEGDSPIQICRNACEGNVLPINQIIPNISPFAGGISMQDSEIIVGNSKFVGNIACDGNKSAGYGGALNFMRNCKAQFSNCTFSANTSVRGGAVYTYTNERIIKFKDCKFLENTSYGRGGAINTHNTKIELENCLIARNTAKIYGGGLYLRNETKIILKNCEIKNNKAGEGGGIYHSASVEITKDGLTKIFDNKGGDIKLHDS